MTRGDRELSFGYVHFEMTLGHSSTGDSCKNLIKESARSCGLGIEICESLVMSLLRKRKRH
jgi:hypothetical protein